MDSNLEAASIKKLVESLFCILVHTLYCRGFVCLICQVMRKNQALNLWILKLEGLMMVKVPRMSAKMLNLRIWYELQNLHFCLLTV